MSHFNLIEEEEFDQDDQIIPCDKYIAQKNYQDCRIEEDYYPQDTIELKTVESLDYFGINSSEELSCPSNSYFMGNIKDYV